MAFTATFPIDIGTYVIVDREDVDLNDPKNLLGRFGILGENKSVCIRIWRGNLI